MPCPTVVSKWMKTYDVYIGEGSKWYLPGIVDDMEAYKVWLLAQVKAGNITKEDLTNLSGKRLGVYRKDRAIHGNVIRNVYKEIIGDLICRV